MHTYRHPPPHTHTYTCIHTHTHTYACIHTHIHTITFFLADYVKVSFGDTDIEFENDDQGEIDGDDDCEEGPLNLLEIYNSSEFDYLSDDSNATMDLNGCDADNDTHDYQSDDKDSEPENTYS